MIACFCNCCCCHGAIVGGQSREEYKKLRHLPRSISLSLHHQQSMLCFLGLLLLCFQYIAVHSCGRRDQWLRMTCLVMLLLLLLLHQCLLHLLQLTKILLLFSFCCLGNPRKIFYSFRLFRSGIELLNAWMRVRHLLAFLLSLKAHVFLIQATKQFSK